MLPFVIVTRPPPLRALKVVRFLDAYYGNEDSGNMRGHYYDVFDAARA
jgi:hypothetical protein